MEDYLRTGVVAAEAEGRDLEADNSSGLTSQTTAAGNNKRRVEPTAYLTLHINHNPGKQVLLVPLLEKETEAQKGQGCLLI